MLSREKVQINYNSHDRNISEIVLIALAYEFVCQLLKREGLGKESTPSAEQTSSPVARACSRRLARCDGFDSETPCNADHLPPL